MGHGPEPVGGAAGCQPQPVHESGSDCLLQVVRTASTIAGVTRSRELVSRRTVLALLAAGSAAGCSGDADPSGSGTRTPAPSTPSAGAGAGALVWANWPEYIDVAGRGRRRPTLDSFVRRNGIEVDYEEVVNDNEEFVSGIGSALEAVAGSATTS